MKTVLRILFFNGEEKDHATEVLEFIEKFETSTTSMGLVTPAHKATHFGSYLRGAAYQIHKSLASVRVDPNDWEAVKAYFLKKFSGEASAHTIINSIFDPKERRGNYAILLQGPTRPTCSLISSVCPMLTCRLPMLLFQTSGPSSRQMELLNMI